MTDDLFAELVRSPLQPEDDRRPGRRWPGLMVAIALGAAAGIAAASLVGDDGGESPAVATTTATDAPAASTPEGLPDGYVEVATGVGVRPELAHMAGGDLEVTLSTALESGHDPAVTPVFPGGSWALESPSGSVVSGSEVHNPEALGVFSVRFDVVPEDGFPDAYALALRPVASEAMVDQSISLRFEEFPTVIEDAGAIEFAEGWRIVIDEVRLGAESGTIEWRLLGAEDTRIRLDVVVRFPELEGQPPGTLVSEHLLPPYPVQLPQKPAPSYTTLGRVEVLRRVGDRIDPAMPTVATVDLTVHVQTISDVLVEVPLGEIPVLEPTG